MISPLTVAISLGTILLTWAIALPIGIYSAVRQHSVGDYVLTFVGFIGMCVPSFLLALLLVYMVLASQYESLRDPLVVMPNPFYQIYEGAAFLAGLQAGHYAALDEVLGRVDGSR